MGDDAKEVKLEDLLSRLLEDSSIHDVTLKGSDGVEVSSNRGILAARSDVFKGMLFGKFVESTQKVVKICEYKGEVLRAVVEYIHTNNAELLRTSAKDRKGKDTDDDGVPMEPLFTLTSLAAAAMYFNLPVLAEKAKDSIEGLLGGQPAQAFVFLNACRQDGQATPEFLYGLVQDCVRSCKMRGHINAPAVAELSENVVEAIMQDDKMEWTELDLFELLKFWADADDSGDRKAFAACLVKEHLSLEKMCPTKLSTVVKSSGLVDTTQLMEAYEKQSLAHVNCSQTDYYQKLRSNPFPLWTRSASATTETSETIGTIDILDCPPMSSGVHTWTLELLELGVETRLGIWAAGTCNFGTYLLGDRLGGWAINQHGQWFYNGASVNPFSTTLRPGDKVTFTLDFNGAGNGALRFSKMGWKGREEVIVSDLRSRLDQFDKGFLPAVSSCEEPAIFRLVDFQSRS